MKPLQDVDHPNLRAGSEKLAEPALENESVGTYVAFQSLAKFHHLFGMIYSLETRNLGLKGVPITAMQVLHENYPCQHRGQYLHLY